MNNQFDEGTEDKIFSIYTVFMGLCVLALGLIGVSVMCSWASVTLQWKALQVINDATSIIKIIQIIVAWFN